MTVTSPRVHAQVTVICVLEALSSFRRNPFGKRVGGFFVLSPTFPQPGAKLSLSEGVLWTKKLGVLS